MRAAMLAVCCNNLFKLLVVHFFVTLGVFNPQFINNICYIANAKTKRNWLIRGHVALDKCNVSLGKQVKNCCPATNIKKTKWRRNSQV